MYLFDIKHQSCQLVYFLIIIISGISSLTMLFNNTDTELIAKILFFFVLLIGHFLLLFYIPSVVFLIDYDPTKYNSDTFLDLNGCNYPNCGVYRTWTGSLSGLTKKTQKEQMLYSNAITRKYALNPVFLSDQGKDLDYIDRFDGCSIGNYAFMAHYNPNTEFETSYKKVIDYFNKTS